MCGIAGFVNKKGLPAKKSIIFRMTEALRHRGPDDEGFFIKKNVALGVRRLSIIDITGGKQPVSNEDGKVSVIFNGEIYNFKELRKKLQSKGHIFKSRSDTEVIVHLYEEEQENLFNQLNGMFAIAIYDDLRRVLILARDRIGEKPLYYCNNDRILIFASELKAIICHPEIKKELNFTALNQYVTFEYVPTPNSIFKNIYKLEAGH